MNNEALYSYTPILMFYDDGDDKDDDQEQQPDLEKTGDYNLGDDLTRAGEGHDTIEDEVT